MSKWEQEPKQHYREAPWALFDLLCLFPLKSQLSKTFFFLAGDSFTWAISAVSNSFPAHLAPSGSVIGGDSSLSVMNGPAHQSKFVVMPLKSDTGGAQCADSACVGKEGWRERRSDAGRDKTVSMQQPKYLQHSSVTEGRLCLNRLTRLVSILDAKTK